jgi:hypothetical protein
VQRLHQALDHFKLVNESTISKCIILFILIEFYIFFIIF